MFKINVTAEDIEKLPSGAFEGEIHVISKVGREFNAAISYLHTFVLQKSPVT